MEYGDTLPYYGEDELMGEATMDDSNCLAVSVAEQLELRTAEERVFLFMRDHDEISDTIKTNHQDLIVALSEDKLMPPMAGVFEGAEGGSGSASQDSVVDEVIDEDQGRIAWDQRHGGMVTYWHYYIKKSFEILLYTIGVSYPGLLKSICAAGASSSFGYIDAVFLCCLYSMIGACGGAASTWIGSVGITLAAYTVIKPLIERYASTNTNSQYIQQNVARCTHTIDEGIISNTRDAWNKTKELIPDILKYPGIGIDRASSVLADVMVTRIMSRTYNFGPGGMAVVQIPSTANDGTMVNLLDVYGLLNLEILYYGEELERKKESRLAILSLKTLTGHIFRIIETKREASRMLAADLDEAETQIAMATGSEKGQIDEGELVRQTSSAGVQELVRQTSNAGVQVNLERQGSGYAALRSKIVDARNELEKMRVINSEQKKELDAEARDRTRAEVDRGGQGLKTGKMNPADLNDPGTLAMPVPPPLPPRDQDPYGSGRRSTPSLRYKPY